MPEIQNLQTGKVGLIQQLADGRVVQLGLTQIQSDMLQMFLASISQEKPLIQLGREYDLTLVIKS